MLNLEAFASFVAIVDARSLGGAQAPRAVEIVYGVEPSFQASVAASPLPLEPRQVTLGLPSASRENDHATAVL